MTAHGDNHRLICPICLKRFESEQGVKAHQKRKRHLTHRMVDEPWAKYKSLITHTTGEQHG